MIPSKGKINRLGQFHFVTSHATLSSPPHLSPTIQLTCLSTNGAKIWKVLWGSKLTLWVVDSGVVSMSYVPYTGIWAVLLKESGRLMMRSGYLASVGDQQVDNETVLQSSTHMTRQGMACTHTQLFCDWSSSLVQWAGLEVVLLVALCWRREWKSESVGTLLVPPQSIFGSQ